MLCGPIKANNMALSWLMKFRKPDLSCLLRSAEIGIRTVSEFSPEEFTENNQPGDGILTGGKCVNEVKLLGYVVRNPQKCQSGSKTFTAFSLGTDRFFHDEGVLQKRTSWHNVIVNVPFLQEYVEKKIVRGSRVYVSGYITYKISDNYDVQKAYVVAQEIISMKQ